MPQRAGEAAATARGATMKRTSISHLLWLAAALLFLAGLEGTAVAQTDYQHVWKYFLTDHFFCPAGTAVVFH